MAMTTEQMMFQIAELRKDKMLFVGESVAVSLLALLLFIGAPSVFPEVINPYAPESLKIMQGIIIAPSAFWLFVMVGNLFRYMKIRKLQKQLSLPKKK